MSFSFRGSWRLGGWQNELREAAATPPRLVSGTGVPATMTRDGLVAFDGRPPVIEWVANETRAEILRSWTLKIQPDAEQNPELRPREIPLSAVATSLSMVQGSGKYHLDLSDPALIGSAGWGMFGVSLFGSIGRDAAFQFMVRPTLKVSHDWNEWRDGTEVTAFVDVPVGARLIGPTSEQSPGRYVVRTASDTVSLSIAVEGFGRCDWTLPFELRVPVPSWALIDENRGSQLVTWSRSPIRASVAELEGHQPKLLFKAVTPWGKATALDIQLFGPTGLIFEQKCTVDSHGFASVDLSMLLTSARHQRASRFEFAAVLQLAQRPVKISFGTLERDWSPTGFQVDLVADEAVLNWNEQFPMDGRCIRVRDLLRPWVDAAETRLTPTDHGKFVAPVKRLFDHPSVWRVSLAQRDEWTGVARDSEACDVRLGVPDEWERALRRDSPTDQTLSRILVDHYVGAHVGLDFGEPETIDPRDFAHKLLRARISLGFKRSDDQVSGKLARLLRGVGLNITLEAIAATEGITPQILLQLGFFTRPGTVSGSVPDDAMETLWRLWPPFGAWAELQCRTTLTEAGQDRLIGLIGAEALKEICPVAAGSKIRLFNAVERSPLKCRLIEVRGAAEASPFALRSMASPTVLRVQTYRDPFGPHLLDLAQTVDGRWAAEAVTSEQVPEELARLTSGDPLEIGVVAFYGGEPYACERPPESQVIDLIRTGRTHVLQQQLAWCSPLPRGPVDDRANRNYRAPRAGSRRQGR